MSHPIADRTSTVKLIPTTFCPLPFHPLPYQGVVLLDLPADEVMAGENRVLNKYRKRKEGETMGDNR